MMTWKEAGGDGERRVGISRSMERQMVLFV